MTKIIAIIIFFILLAGVFTYAGFLKKSSNPSFPSLQFENDIEKDPPVNPLQIDVMRKKMYPGSDIVIEETLSSGSNYHRYITSYTSEGLKIYALLTVPAEDKPAGGFPVIIFNHGYIPPKEYKTAERYIAYVDGFARNGYIVFRPDYRGHGNSQGEPSGAYGSPDYTVDVLNAVSSIKRYRDANPEKIGMWGHSMGGFITLRSMVITEDIKAGVIWGGVVASYQDLLYNWRRGPTGVSLSPPPGIPTGARRWRQTLIDQYGTPEGNPSFWNSLSANSFLSDISGPLQLHHGEQDESVPLEFSEKLYNELKTLGKTVELFTYPGNDHNISQSFGTAMDRSVNFFDTYLKKK